ncbi:hypothetical protein GCM10027199_68930 [Amycolatopsis magusensis]
MEEYLQKIPIWKLPVDRLAYFGSTDVLFASTLYFSVREWAGEIAQLVEALAELLGIVNCFKIDRGMIFQRRYRPDLVLDSLQPGVSVVHCTSLCVHRWPGLTVNGSLRMTPVFHSDHI